MEDSITRQDYYLAYLRGYKDSLDGKESRACPYDDSEMLHLEGYYDGYDDAFLPIPEMG
jgi:ribosome modulation factor